MTTPNEPAAIPAEETITPAPTSEQSATENEQVQPEENQQAQPQYVTKEELDQITEDIVRRVKQSDRDRSKRIEGEIGKIKTLLEKAGAQVTPEQEAEIRNQITDQIDGDQEPQPDGQSAAPPVEPPTAASVDNFLSSVFAEAGEEVTPNDPEWKDLKKVLDDNFNNPNGMPKVLVAATKAAEAKKVRKASMQETATARVGGGGSNANNSNSNLTPDQKISKGLKGADWGSGFIPKETVQE